MKSNRLMPPLVFITGSSDHLGAYLAQSFSENGFRVLLHYRTNRIKAMALARKIKAEAVFKGDLSEGRVVAEIFDEIKKRFGRLDCLVNNAGHYSGKRLGVLTEREWQEGINSTATAVFLVTKALLPMIRRSESGRIINIGDSSCDRATARDLAMSYHIGKTGVLMLTKSFAQAEACHGITVNMVSPGWLDTSVGSLSKKVIPAGRYGQYQDIWNAVEFIIKRESNYLNGSNLVVSGGWNLR